MSCVNRKCGLWGASQLTAHGSCRASRGQTSWRPGRGLLAERQWIGRAVRSSDGRYLGDVAGVNEDNPLELYVDIADFLALGERRISLLSDQLEEITRDRIVLRLTEPEARNSPPPDTDGEEL
jgi:hypothetical protein